MRHLYISVWAVATFESLGKTRTGHNNANTAREARNEVEDTQSTDHIERVDLFVTSVTLILIGWSNVTHGVSVFKSFTWYFLKIKS